MSIDIFDAIDTIVALPLLLFSFAAFIIFFFRQAIDADIADAR